MSYKDDLINKLKALSIVSRNKLLNINKDIRKNKTKELTNNKKEVNRILNKSELLLKKIETIPFDDYDELLIIQNDFSSIQKSFFNIGYISDNVIERDELK